MRAAGVARSSGPGREHRAAERQGRARPTATGALAGPGPRARRRVRATRGSGSGRCGWPACTSRGRSRDRGRRRPAAAAYLAKNASGIVGGDRARGWPRPRSSPTEKSFGTAQRDHQPRVRAQVAHLDRVGLAETDQQRLAVPPEPRRDEVREAVRADRGQPHDGLRGQHRPHARRASGRARRRTRAGPGRARDAARSGDVAARMRRRNCMPGGCGPPSRDHPARIVSRAWTSVDAAAGRRSAALEL